jgi:hypothetical protein
MRRAVITLTPRGCRHFRGQVCAWLRLHRLDPDVTQNVYVWPWLRLIAAVTFERKERGTFFVLDGVVAWRWAFRRLRLPPAAEWCAG